MNLFWNTRRFTSSREDHLTEFFAASLKLSPSARKRYFDVALRQFAAKNGWRTCQIQDIETQCSFDGTTCCPDMVLTLSNGKRIACEHKLDAPETAGPECDPRGQLSRYLALPIDGLVYVRESWKAPERHVLEHRKYIRPASGAEHFLWRDFYCLFEDAEDQFLCWMREALNRLGFTPPHAQIGELVATEDRRNFAKYWGKTKSFAHNHGWYVGIGSIAEIYLSENSSALASMVYVQPSPSRFLLRVTPKQHSRDECFSLLSKSCGTSPCEVQLEKTLVRRTKGKAVVFDITATASSVIGVVANSPAEIEERLFQFVSHFIVPLQTRGTAAQVLADKLIAGLDSGTPIPFTPGYIREKKRRLVQRHSRKA
jgi:hypothetical protein